MKKYALVLVLVGVITLSAVGTAVAQTYPVTLCMTGNGSLQTNLIATYAGNIEGKSVYVLNGWIENSETEIAVSGTAMVAGSDINWGLTLHSIFWPGVWEFNTGLDLNGAGSWQRLIEPEDSANMSVSAGPCP